MHIPLAFFVISTVMMNLSRLLVLYLQVLPTSILDTSFALWRATSSARDSFDWQPCSGLENDPRYECGLMHVAVDPMASNAGTLRLHVQRYRAVDSIGTIFVHRGGASAMLASASMSVLLGGRHDILAFDPRGTGLSENPCAPMTECKHRSMSHVAADLNAVQLALHLDQLDFYGISIGTVLGQVYASEFPDAVGRLALDAPVDATELVDEWPVGDVEAAFEAFAAECETAGPGGCPLADAMTPRPYLAARLNRFLEQLAEGTPGTGCIARRAIARALAAPHAWPVLAGDLDAFMKSHAPPEAWGNASDCTALSGQENWATVSASASFTSATALSTAVVRPGHTPLLILSAEVDPVTSRRSAEALATKWGVHAALVVRDGVGHGAAIGQPSACVRKALGCFFSTGVMPASKRCPVDARPFQLQLEALVDQNVIAMYVVASAVLP
ncbi:hypothetical protein ACHHYP_07288 [Achlya hypogyna]|uniref:Uncharacterized protein n=1 Tax=Achlya hypogyna TaxID=1202772 RepID=A0A1V9YR83_ACHHY|nr:hypothetical protein ACHHYP_07288 [Achlya hypogyna]